MGKIATIFFLGLTSLIVAGVGAASAQPVDATGVTVTFVDATVTPSSSRPSAATIGFQANAGAATVGVRYSADADQPIPPGPVRVSLNGEPLVEPLDVRRAGGETNLDVNLLEGLNQLQVTRRPQSMWRSSNTSARRSRSTRSGEARCWWETASSCSQAPS